MFLCRIRPKNSFRFVEVMTNFSVYTTVKLAVFVQLAVSVASYGFLIRSLNGFERGVYAFVALSGFLGFTYDANFWYVAVALFMTISGYVFVSNKTQG